MENQNPLYPLFLHIAEEHGLILLESELMEIVLRVRYMDFKARIAAAGEIDLSS